MQPQRSESQRSVPSHWQHNCVSARLLIFAASTATLVVGPAVASHWWLAFYFAVWTALVTAGYLLVDIAEMLARLVERDGE